MSLGLLPERERQIVILRGQGETWTKIGTALELTPERIRVLHQQAMHRLEQLRIGRQNSPERFYRLERFGEVRIIDPPRVTVRCGGRS